MSHSLLLPTKRALALACEQPVSPCGVGVPFLHLCTNRTMIFLTGKFLFSECGQMGRWAGTRRPRSGASPLRGSPDWRRDHCWNRHCGRAEGAADAPRHPAWRSRLPGVPDSLSPGKARRWRVSVGSWSCVRGRGARASSRRPSGPIRCTRSYSFRSLPHQGGSGYLWAGERERASTMREGFIVINIWKTFIKNEKKKSRKKAFVNRNGVI